jgi:hypothetical protein
MISSCDSAVSSELPDESIEIASAQSPNYHGTPYDAMALDTHAFVRDWVADLDMRIPAPRHPPHSTTFVRLSAISLLSGCHDQVLTSYFDEDGHELVVLATLRSYPIPFYLRRQSRAGKLPPIHVAVTEELPFPAVVREAESARVFYWTRDGFLQQARFSESLLTRSEQRSVMNSLA